MPIKRTKDEIEFLSRVDERYRAGDTQAEIAAAEGFDSVGALQGRVGRLGFKFDRRGGLRLVDTLMGREFVDWVSSDEISATEPADAECSLR